MINGLCCLTGLALLRENARVTYFRSVPGRVPLVALAFATHWPVTQLAQKKKTDKRSRVCPNETNPTRETKQILDQGQLN